MEDEEYGRRLALALEDARREGGFLRLAALYRKGTPAQRELVRSAWTPRHGWKLPSLTDFPLKNPLPHAQRLATHLLFASIENLRMDWRDTLIGICAVYHIALKVGLDPKALFDDAASISAPEFAKLLADFLRRKPEDMTLAAFGWTDKSTPDRVLLLG